MNGNGNLADTEFASANRRNFPKLSPTLVPMSVNRGFCEKVASSLLNSKLQDNSCLEDSQISQPFTTFIYSTFVIIKSRIRGKPVWVNVGNYSPR